MFSNYLETALRNLWVNKTYSLLNIFGLSVGVTCAALIFLWTEHELTFDHQHGKGKYLYQVYNNQFAIAGTAALLVALARITFHAIRAAVANPVKSLRRE